jgi:STE24 endopeptidase
MSEITARRTVRIFALGAGAALWLLAASLLWRTQVPADLRLPALEPRSEFSRAHLDATADYARVARALWVASNLVQLAVLGLLVWLGPRLAARVPGGRLRRGLTLLVIVLTTVWLARLPVRAVSHWWRRRHGLSDQGYFDWLTDPWLELAASAGIACVALAAAMLLARRFGRRWWLAGAPVLAVVGAAVVLIQPLVDTPRLEPLRNPKLAAEIRGLAREIGVGKVDVDVKDASERTTTANAEVTGIGPTRRVVLWDTLLDGRFTPGEIRFIAAHELAHVARRHVWKGVAWFALLVVPCAYVLAEVTRRRGGISEPAAVPLAVLTVVALQLALLPLANLISRRYEAEADWVALEATRDPGSMRRLMRRFSETSLAQPDPPTWAYLLRSNHPSLLERIAMADAWGSRSWGAAGPS